MSTKTKTKRKRMSERTVTTRKSKVIGTQEYIDRNTGEIVQMEVVSIEDQDFNFMKIFLMNLLNQIDQVGNKKTSVMFFIIDNLDKDNMFYMTQTEVATELGIGRTTVNESFKILENANFLKKIRDGKYQVNPSSVFKGAGKKRMRVLLDYEAVGRDEKGRDE